MNERQCAFFREITEPSVVIIIPYDSLFMVQFRLFSYRVPAFDSVPKNSDKNWLIFFSDIVERIMEHMLNASRTRRQVENFLSPPF